MNWLEELEHINDIFHVSAFTDDLQIVYAKPSTPFFEDEAPIIYHKKYDLIHAKNILVGVLSNFEENLENRSVQYRTDNWDEIWGYPDLGNPWIRYEHQVRLSWCIPP